MSEDFKLVENPERPLSMHPKKFALWLFMISVMMIFISFSSAYLVKKGDGNWRVFDLPDMFWVISGIVLASSATLHYAVINAKKDEIGKVKVGLNATVLLGLAFLVGQIFSYRELIDANVYFTGGNPAESFIYVLSGVHWFHLLSGLIFGIIVLVNAYRYKIHSKSLLQLQMFATYWHFLGGLWIYLFVFFILNHQ